MSYLKYIPKIRNKDHVIQLERSEQNNEFLCTWVYRNFSDTKNELTQEVGGYEHVMVLRNIGVVDGDIIETLQPLPRGTHDGDCIHYYRFITNLFLINYLIFFGSLTVW